MKVLGRQTWTTRKFCAKSVSGKKKADEYELWPPPLISKGGGQKKNGGKKKKSERAKQSLKPRKEKKEIGDP